MASLMRIAVTQMTSSSDITQNMARIEKMIEYAAKKEARMIFFPENFHFMGTSKDSSLQIAESIDGKYMQQYATMARRNNVRSNGCVRFCTFAFRLFIIK